MRISKVTKLKETWEAYPDDPDKATFKIGMLSPGERADIESKATRLIIGDDGQQDFEFDHMKSDTLRALTALRDWDNVFDDDEGTQRLPFNQKDKMRLVNGMPGFREWILEKLEKLVACYAAEQEAERKNLSLSANG